MPGSFIANELENTIQTYREQRFTGLVKVTSPEDYQWFIYYLLGRIVWTNSRTHSLRRWQRHLAIHSPVFFERITQPVSLSYESWNYVALAKLVKQKQFRRDQFSGVIESCIAEDLFDILQVATLQHNQSGQSLRYEAYAKEAANLPFIMLQQDRVWQEARQAWLLWEQAGLAHISPDWAPIITQLELLQRQTPPQTFKTLTTFVDGNRTLRDLSIKFKEPIIPLVKSILPYLSRKMLGLIEVPDLVGNAQNGFNPELLQIPKTAERLSSQVEAEMAKPSQPQPGMAKPFQENKSIRASRPSTAYSQSLPSTPRGQSNEPQIVYIDDSPADSRAMREIVENVGCHYTNIPDPLQALPLLIELKPDLIFLDLVMPIANGYEVCAQIRRISSLKAIPVIIVTSNDGIADRVRAKIVGASGFLGKPIQYTKVLKVLKKHLRHTVLKKHLRYVTNQTDQQQRVFSSQ